MGTLSTRYGKQALVTGASIGIGREFARQVAAAGMDVIIAARSLDKLEELATESRTNHDVKVTPIRAQGDRIKT